ncbi:hypothetical protein D3C73_1188900 [compost metagenome]
MHHLPQFAAGYWVYAHAGLIQQQHFGFADQRTGKAQFLLHAAGEFPRQTSGKRPQRGKLQQPGKGFLPRFTGNAA